MKDYRKISSLFKSQPTVEGAGVHLKRAFGYHQVPLLDPFLLLQKQIPEILFDNGVKIKILSGEADGTKGPVRDIAVDCTYLDVAVPVNAEFEYRVRSDDTVFAYVIDGTGYFDADQKQQADEDHLVLFTAGDHIKIIAGDRSVRFLLVSGKPIKEPVAWYGPIVMNTREELQIAFEDYQKGTFIKAKVAPRPQPIKIPDD